MSPIRIAIELLIGSLLGAALLISWWHFGFSPKWIAIMVPGTGAIISLSIGVIQEQKALRPYWQRYCTGFRWRRQFPEAPKEEVREFLTLFLDAFGFSHKRRCCFLPEDRVMDVYRTLNPPGSLIDALELETLVMDVQKRYRTDLVPVWHQYITLGEIYAQAHQPR